MSTNNAKAESSTSRSPNRRVTGGPQSASPSVVNEDQNDPVVRTIELYNEYRNALHGIVPAWELPTLDINVNLSFPGISG